MAEQYPTHRVIDVVGALFDPEVPDDVAKRLLHRRHALRRFVAAEPCPEEDRPFLARHIVEMPS